MKPSPSLRRIVPATEGFEREQTFQRSGNFFFDRTRGELDGLFERSYRAVQLYEAVYQQGIDDIARITSFPKSLRFSLKDHLDIRPNPVEHTFEAADGTRRHMVRLSDGEVVETVFIPDGKRNTICVSSQVGCALACAFCLTGQLGFGRNLTAGEIVSQVVQAQRENISADLRSHFNIVLMGMGEPLHNYTNVMKALAILNDPVGLGVSMSRITLSTAGLIPELERLAEEPRIPNLAISMTGATDRKRDALMPINRTYPIEGLVRVLRRFRGKTRQPVTLEYVLLHGITDSAADADRLANIALLVGAKVNVIPLNESPDLGFRRPDPESIVRFQNVLRARGVPAFVRKSRGDDISAACGQLKKKWARGVENVEGAWSESNLL